MRCFSHPFCLVLLLTACGSGPTGEPLQEETICSIGETDVQISSHQWSGSDLVFINLHDDENTGVEACLTVLAKRGGRLVQLRHDGSRLVSFTDNDKVFTFDPNRIFTNEGARQTLKTHGSFSRDTLSSVQNFAAQFLSICRFDELALVVTVHNNSDQGFSATSYCKGGSYVADARAVHVEPDVDPDDFFFVTDERLFEVFRLKHFNVVLQENATVTDDGSLSVLAGRREIPYINIEAQEGHFQQQLKMLAEVYAAAEVLKATGQ